MSWHAKDSTNTDVHIPAPDGSASLYQELEQEFEQGPMTGGSANSTYQAEAATAMNGNRGTQYSADTMTSITQYFESITDGSVVRWVPRLFGSTDRPSFGQVVSHAGELLESVHAERFPRSDRYRPQCVIANQRIDDNTTLVSLLLRSPRVGSGGSIQGYGDPYRYGMSFMVTNNNDGTVTVRPFRDGNGPVGTHALRIDDGANRLRLHSMGRGFQITIR